MTTETAVADTANKTVSFGGKTYQIQALGDDSYTVLVAGVPVGRIVYSFGAANGVPEGEARSFLQGFPVTPGSARRWCYRLS